MQESWLRDPRQGSSSEQAQSWAEVRENAAIKGTLLHMLVCLVGKSLRNSKCCLKIVRSEQGQLSEEAVAAGTEKKHREQRIQAA